MTMRKAEIPSKYTGSMANRLPEQRGQKCQKRVDFYGESSYNIQVLSGRSSVWLERYLGVVEAARSSRVAPTR